MTYYACYVEELIAPLLLRQLPAGNAVCCATHQCGKATCDATESSCQWLESVKSQITAIAIGNGALKWNTLKAFYCSNHLPTLAQSLFATSAVVAASFVRACSSIFWEHACLALYCQRAQRINACQHAQRANARQAPSISHISLTTSMFLTCMLPLFLRLRAIHFARTAKA